MLILFLKALTHLKSEASTLLHFWCDNHFWYNLEICNFWWENPVFSWSTGEGWDIKKDALIAEYSLHKVPGLSLSLFLHMVKFIPAPTFRIANLVQSFPILQSFLEVHSVPGIHPGTKLYIRFNVIWTKAFRVAIAVSQSNKYVPPRSQIFNHGNIKWFYSWNPTRK